MKTKTLFASALAVLGLTACEKGLVDEAAVSTTGQVGNSVLQVHCLPMTAHCGNLAYNAHDGMERKRAMPSTMQSLQAMSSCYFVKL